MDLHKVFDVIVIGGGHAGTEAALASARMGADTLLLTHSLDALGQLSCNPAIGGIGKGHLVKEIDALDGVMAVAADEAGIQFRTLNSSKGPAVRATRAQADRVLYRQAIRPRLENQENLTLFQQSVDNLIIKNHRITGVVTQLGLAIRAKTVILTVGTFLGGKIHVGNRNHAGGRAGDPPAIALAQQLRALGLPVGRLKTGTPPRIDIRSIDLTNMVKQPGDEPTPVFSYLGSTDDHPKQICCYITHTTEKAHEIILQNLHLSAMYSGGIEGIGPRYCPSIEDKIVRFADKSSHQIFVEPEGLTSLEIYPNGISTSLPFEVQLQFVRSIKGFEKAHITRAGYAIEYDYFDPRGLTPFLQTKPVKNLFFAGQINGTTGYEEAGAQGIIAGLNAACFAQDNPMWSPRRDQAYIGVLIDDLVTNGTQEPYRMFTSRAEYRLMLREDNADIRLTEIGYQLGLVSEKRWSVFCQKQEAIAKTQAKLKDAWVRLKHNETLNRQLEKSLVHDTRADELLKRPEIQYRHLQKITELGLPELSAVEAEQVEIQCKYAGYIERQKMEIDRLRKHEQTQLPENLDYQNVVGLSAESVQKLSKIRPKTLAQANRISGVTPADVSLLLVHLKKLTLTA